MSPLSLFFYLLCISLSLAATPQKCFDIALTTQQVVTQPLSLGVQATGQAIITGSAGAWDLEVSLGGVVNSPITSIALYGPAPLRVSGALVATVGVVPVTLNFSGVKLMATLTDAELVDLLAGNYYISIATTTFPGGEIRGQIYETPCTFCTQSSISSPTSNIYGTASGFITYDLLVFQYKFAITFTDPTVTIMAASIVSVTEAVVYDIGNTAPLDRTWTSTDVVPLTVPIISELRNGNLHYLITTSAGTFRGPILPTTCNHCLHTPLSASAQVPSNPTLGTGALVGLLSGIPGFYNLDFQVTYNGINPIVNGHFHAPAAVTANAPIVYNIPFVAGSTKGNLSDTWTTLSDDNVLDFLTGQTYINIHTTAYGGGEIRGNIESSPCSTCFIAHLDPQQQSAIVVSNANGSAHGVLTGRPGNWEFRYYVKWTGLTAVPVSAHIHGPAFVTLAGPIVHYLYLSPTTSGVYTGTWKSTDPYPLTDKLAGDLLHNLLYFNIHTSTNPAGEIRGQITAIPCPTQRYYSTNLDATQTVPSNPSTGIGSASFFLSGDALFTELLYSVQFSQLVGTSTHAFLKEGGVGAVGPEVHALNELSGGTNIGGFTGKGKLSPTGITKLFGGLLHIDIDTTQGTEIRGQIAATVAKSDNDSLVVVDSPPPPTTVPSSPNSNAVVNIIEQDTCINYLTCGVCNSNSACRWCRHSRTGGSCLPNTGAAASICLSRRGEVATSCRWNRNNDSNNDDDDNGDDHQFVDSDNDDDKK